MRKKDVVLMATVTSFESLGHPSRSELRQFAELFGPLFAASSETARREAVAALSQCETVPAAVAYFIATQPIAIAASFLIASPCLSDEALIAVARTQGSEHARTIARREKLSPTVIDALVGLRHDRNLRSGEGSAGQATGSFAEAATTAHDPAETARLAREENLRRRVKLLAGHMPKDEETDDRLGLRQISDMQAALMVRFARNRETGQFCHVLADTLSASAWLAQRILLDISGRQLATALKGMFMAEADATYVLGRLYDHLTRPEAMHGQAGPGAQLSRAEKLWASLERAECGHRLESWRRADRYTHAEIIIPQQDQDAALDDAAGPVEHEASMSRPLRTSASIRRAARGR